MINKNSLKVEEVEKIKSKVFDKMFGYHILQKYIDKQKKEASNFIDTSPRFLLYHKNHRFFSRLCELFVNFQENKTAHHQMSGR